MRRYSWKDCDWTRVECAEWVKSKKCPECRVRKLQPGPDDDRFKVWCGNCGWRGRVKPPEEALDEQPV